MTRYLVLAALSLLSCHDPLNARSSSLDLDRCYFLNDRIFVQEKVRHRGGMQSGSQLEAYDVNRGALLARETLAVFSSYELVGATDQGWWFTAAEGQLVELDPKTLKQIAGPTEINAKAGITLSPSTAVWLPETDTIYVQSNKGQGYTINPATLAATAFTGPPPRALQRTGLSSVGEIGDGRTLRFTDDKVKAMRIGKTPLAPEITYLNPKYVAQSPFSALVLQGPEGVLIAHDDVLEAPTKLNVTRVEVSTGKQLWTAVLEPGKTIAAAVRGDQLLLAIDRPAPKFAALVSLNAANGQVRWTTVLKR